MSRKMVPAWAHQWGLSLMTQLENIVIKPHIANGLVDFYCYVNITLLVVKQEDADHIYSLLNTFYCNLRFIVGVFDKKVPPFLDLEMSSDGISIFRKDTKIGLYVNFNSFVLWSYRISCIRIFVSYVSTYFFVKQIIFRNYHY